MDVEFFFPQQTFRHKTPLSLFSGGDPKQERLNDQDFLFPRREHDLKNQNFDFQAMMWQSHANISNTTNTIGDQRMNKWEKVEGPPKWWGVNSKKRSLLTIQHDHWTIIYI